MNPGCVPASLRPCVPASLGVLFTGDAVANRGRTVLGVFDTDRARAVESLRRLTRLDADTAVFGHGAPMLRGAATA